MLLRAMVATLGLLLLATATPGMASDASAVAADLGPKVCISINGIAVCSPGAAPEASGPTLCVTASVNGQGTTVCV